MGIEYIVVKANGTPWTALKSITIRAAYNEAARSFSFVVAAEAGASATNKVFSKGAEIEISSNGDLMLKGYVNRRQPSMGPRKAEITVSGRSASADLVDGSAEHKTGNFKNKDPKEIADEISKNYTQTGFITDQKLEKLEQYKVTPGESCFRCIEKMARQEGMTITGTNDGKAKITKAGKARHAGMLWESEMLMRGNMLEASADHNESNEHSKITVLGQRPFGHGVNNLEIEAIAKDLGVKRHRPIIIIQDEDTTKDRSKKRAKNRRDRAAGEALKATISTQGFRDEAGKLWEPGHLIWVESEFLDIAQDMLIESVDFTQDENGSISALSLTGPESYGGESGKGDKSGSEWSQSSDDAE